MLDQAALDAVQQWEDTPSLLHGVPVPVTMTITIDFKPSVTGFQSSRFS